MHGQLEQEEPNVHPLCLLVFDDPLSDTRMCVYDFQIVALSEAPPPPLSLSLSWWNVANLNSDADRHEQLGYI